MKFIKRLRGLFKKKLAPQERALVDRYLDVKGKRLFFQMSLVDQYHACMVATFILVETHPREGDGLNTLVTAALLHDIGKADGRLNLGARLVAGLVRRLCPDLRRRFAGSHACNFWSRLKYTLYIDWAHPERGAAMARQAGFAETVAQLIQHHHDPRRSGQNSELTLLQRADDRN